MLAETPPLLQADWREYGNNHHLIRDGEIVGLVCKLGGHWYAEADRDRALRGRRDSRATDLGRWPSRLAAMRVVEDALLTHSSFPDSYQSGFTSCAGA